MVVGPFEDLAYAGLKCGRDDRLEVELQPVLNLCGDSLKIFCIWYSATTPAAADDYLTTHVRRRREAVSATGAALDFRFADFEIDIARHELRRAGAIVHIEPQVALSRGTPQRLKN
jgi:hypothetical protein